MADILLDIGASLVTVTSLTNLPVTSKTVYATLDAATSMSLSEEMFQGQMIEVVINPTATFIKTVPTTGGWYSTFGDTLTLIKGTWVLLTIYCNGEGLYTVQCNQKDMTNGYDYVDLGLLITQNGLPVHGVLQHLQ